MVMANAARTGNCRRRSVKGKVLSEGVSVMRGISTCLPLCRPVLISALITFGCSCFTTNRVPCYRAAERRCQTMLGGCRCGGHMSSRAGCRLSVSALPPALNLFFRMNIVH